MFADTQVITLLERMQSHCYILARRFNLLVDDVLQDLAILAMEHQDIAGNVEAYLLTALKYKYLSAAQKTPDVLSLDEPLSDDTNVTRADLLEAPEPTPTPEQPTPKEQALYDALHRLAPDEQRYLARVYGLPVEFKVNTKCIYRNRNRARHRTNSSISLSAYSYLRKDTQLAFSLSK